MTAHDRDPSLGARHGGLRIAVEDVALPSKAHEHSEDRRRLAGVRKEFDTNVDRPGGGAPVSVSCAMRKPWGWPRCGAELGRRIWRSGERMPDPANAFAEPASYPPIR